MPEPHLAPHRSWEGICLRCAGRRVAISNDVTSGLQRLMAHFVEAHQITRGMLTDGEDFTFGPAPERCDLCSTIAERPFWTYVTSPAWRDVEDPQWLVCDPCAALVESSDTHDGLVRLYTRMVTCQAAITGLPKDDLRATMSRMAVLFRLHKISRSRDAS